MKMNMSNFNFQKFTEYVVPALTFVVLIALIPLVIMPQLGRIAQANSTLKSKTARLDTLNKKFQVLQSLDSADIEGKLQNVEIALPSGKGLAPMIEAIKKLSANANLVVNAIKLNPGKIASNSATPAALHPNQPAPTTKLKSSLEVAVELSGKTVDFEKFLSLVEKAKRIVIVESLIITKNPGKPDNFSLTLGVPFQPISTDSSDILAQPVPELSGADQQLYDTLMTQFSEYSSAITAGSCQNGCGVKNPF